MLPYEFVILTRYTPTLPQKSQVHEVFKSNSLIDISFSMQIFSSPQTLNFLILLSVFITEIATDIYLPSTRCLLLEFHTTQEMIALTLSSNFAGLALSAPLYGALSDSFGRKPVMLLGLCIFTVMSVACALTSSIELLIAFRLIQGIGAGVTYPVGVAMQKDIFSGRQFAKARATMSIACAASPAIGPVIGGYIVTLFSWQWTFIAVGIGAFIVAICLMLMPETLEQQEKRPFSYPEMIQNYSDLITYKPFMKFALVTGCISSIYWSFLSGMTFLFLNEFKIPACEYPYYQLVLVGVFIMGTIVNRILAESYEPDTLIQKSLTISTICCIAFILVTWFMPDHPISIIACMIPICGCLGILFPNLGLRAIEVGFRVKGYASAAYTTIELLIPSLAVVVVGKIYNKTAFSFVAFMLALHVVAIGIWRYYGSQIVPYHDQQGEA